MLVIGNGSAVASVKSVSNEEKQSMTAALSTRFSCGQALESQKTCMLAGEDAVGEYRSPSRAVERH